MSRTDSSLAFAKQLILYSFDIKLCSPPSPKDGFNVKDAMKAILDLFNGGLLVAFDREIRYRLENSFPHDIVGRAIGQLQEEKKIVQTDLPGRPGAGDRPNQFYRLPTTDYKELRPIMKKKLELSIFIVGVSTRMGIHAERAWWNAFRRNHWEVYPSSDEVPLGINNYQGRRSSTDHDIDFVAKKDSISYGVEVKNGLNYPNDLYWKFSVGAELDTIPLIIARWLNPAQIPLIEDLGGTKPLVYKDGIYATTYQQLVSEARQILNAPIEARDEVEDTYFHKKLDPIHQDTLTNFTAKQAKIKDFLLRRRTESSVRGILGTGQ